MPLLTGEYATMISGSRDTEDSGARPEDQPASPTVAASATSGLASRLRTLTAPYHVRAERAGIVRDIVRGHATKAGHILLLRNLLLVYEALEQGLTFHRATAGTGRFFRPALFRAPAIARDLAALSGPAWRESLAPLPEGVAYAGRVAAAADRGAGEGLIGHAYTRYLGDLSGGAVVRAALVRHVGLTPDAAAFFSFPDVEDPEALKAAFRDDLDRAESETVSPDAIVAGAIEAFECNIALSEAVKTAAAE